MRKDASLITRSGYPDLSSARADGALFVAIPQLQSVLSVDVATGDYQVVSNKTRGTGPLWFDMADLAVGQGNDLLLADPFTEMSWAKCPLSSPGKAFILPVRDKTVSS
jgi:hypothetical protein